MLCIPLCFARPAAKCPFRRRHTSILAAFVAACFAPLPAVSAQTQSVQAAPGKPAAVSRHLLLPEAHSKNLLSVTVTAIDDNGVHATLPNGTEMDADIKRGSQFLVNGRLVTPDQFPASGQAWLRTRTRASDGAVSVVVLADPASEAAMDAYRKQILVGHVVSVDDKTLVVRPGSDPNATPISLHLTAKTVFWHNGQESSVVSFAADGLVAVQTRSLPSGLLMASVVSDSPADLAKEKASVKTTSLSGSAAVVDLDKQQIKILSKTKPGQTIAVADNTRIKVRKMVGTLKDITPGMHVSARLSSAKDSDGHLVAVSLSAYDAPVPMAKKKSLSIKAAPAAAKKP